MLLFLLFFLEGVLKNLDAIDQILADNGVGPKLCLETADPLREHFLFVLPFSLSDADLRVLFLDEKDNTSRKLMTETQFTFYSSLIQIDY